MAFARPVITINQRMLHEDLTISVVEYMPEPRGAESPCNLLGEPRLVNDVSSRTTLPSPSSRTG
eukprot:3698055-Pyramimonas_sp.AAC.1